MSDYVNDSLEQKMAAMIQNRTTYRERLADIEAGRFVTLEELEAEMEEWDD